MKKFLATSALISANASTMIGFYHSYQMISRDYESAEIVESVEEIIQYEDLDPAMQVFYNEDLEFPLITSARPKPRSEEIHNRCLATNIYHEGRGESVSGQMKIAFVTVNRVGHRRWADNVCSVVYEPEQFSWTLFKPKINFNNPEAVKAFDIAYEIASKVIEGEVQDTTNGANHYYAINEMKNKEKPWWADSYQVVEVHGGHTFLK